MSSESEFEAPSEEEYQSEEQGSDEGSRRPSRRHTIESMSPARKRARRSRSDSVEALRDSKRHLKGLYNDSYRILFNETLASVTNTFPPHYATKSPNSQIGVSKWTSEEKDRVFAAVERLGRDNLPGISSAVGSKSIPEVKDFLLLLKDATTEHDRAAVDYRDIPAAAEISSECCQQLELAGDALSSYQETFEAKVEQDRYGKHWLITPEIAEEIEVALASSKGRSSSHVSSTSDSGAAETNPEKVRLSPAPDNPSNVEILQSIPSSSLLRPISFLTLSMKLFMNSSSTLPSAYPHWTHLTSQLASGPSIYHTALNDFHTLAISLTKRLAQASMMQATSRLRSQNWRFSKGVKPFVKKRDVLAAIDILGLQRNRSENWRAVARRCKVRVLDGTGKNRRELGWDEVEEILALPRKGKVGLDETDFETDGEGFTTDATTDAEFKARSFRAATPLPERISEVSDDQSEEEYHNETKNGSDNQSEADSEKPLSEPEDSAPSSASNSPPSRGRSSRKILSEPEMDQFLEHYDQKIGHEEEVRICSLLGFSPPRGSKEAFDIHMKGKQMSKEINDGKNWRDWTEYRAAWEVFSSPVPEDKFRENRKGMKVYTGLQTGNSLVAHSEDKREQTSKRELPIRGARAYAARREISPEAGDASQYSAEEEEDVQEEQIALPSVEQAVDDEMLDTPMKGDTDADADTGRPRRAAQKAARESIYNSYLEHTVDLNQNFEGDDTDDE
ncbi:hypothetical protein GQ43DRAFT_211923 [Delitschia confertaspora ATCC 74209]|uniref:Myb-like domain-containing protein n=1 Tax=Delitschia confertaspora ATCC 74209 TaxID=1513339 RepID=A0A9P4JTE1_9PLEO|nr:hypothetical protein GQ43DRAFT_211923 [Delitschia confertaspora ATCC 74209]